MTAIDAAILGAIQGLTEFLPVSSDGHLTLTGLLLGLQASGRDAVGFEIVLHAASLVALLLCYGATWWKLALSLLPGGDRRDRWLLLLLVVATIPGALAGLLLEDMLTNLWRDLTGLGAFFLVTALLLVIGEHPPVSAKPREMRDAGLWTAIAIGVSQAFALLPALSRSGSTVSVGRLMGLSRRDALDFSFLMAAPILAGATLVTMLDVAQGEVTLPATGVTLAGFLSSLLVSVAAVTLLRRLVARYPLSLFSWYLVPLGLACLWFGSAGTGTL